MPLVLAAALLTVFSSRNPSTTGERIRLTINASSPITGTVIVREGDNILGQSNIVPFDVTPEFDTPGIHKITIEDQGGASTTFEQYVGDVVTSLSLAAPTSAKSGQELTLTASLPCCGSDPTGSVTFSDGATVLGVAPVSGGSAMLKVSLTGGGSHSIRAVYSGDVRFSPSAAVTRIVVQVQQRRRAATH